MNKIKIIGLWSWRLTPLSTIFQLCRGGQFFLVPRVPGENHGSAASMSE